MTSVESPATEPIWGVWGNSAAVERMQRAVRQGPRHSYVFSGPSSVGKSRLATAFAAALICPESSDPGVPCGTCSTCRRVARGVHPDVARFDLAYQVVQDDGKSRNTSLNIGTVRDIARHASLRPVEAQWRVVVVDDVESMQETAQEAFLKTLEEPPSYVVLLLLTTDAELLLPTILSRCALVTLSTVPESQVQQALETQGASSAQAKSLALASQGKVGLAVRALSDDSLRNALQESVTQAIDWISGDAYSRMVTAIRLADRFTESREAVFDQLLAAELAWRELLRDSLGLTSATDHPVLARFRLGSVIEGHQALVAIGRCIRDLEANVRPRAALETMVQGWPLVQQRGG